MKSTITKENKDTVYYQVEFDGMFFGGMGRNTANLFAKCLEAGVPVQLASCHKYDTKELKELLNQYKK